MKAIKYLFILGISLFTATSCMNDFDEPKFTTPPFGNNNIGEANTTIAEIKSKFASVISSSSYQEVTDDIVIEGVVVANDKTGNIYKQIVIADETGAIIIGINDVGLYAMMQLGQKIAIDCKGLYVGGYAKLAQIGGLYNGSIGRMDKLTFPKHVKLIGKPAKDMHGIEPQVIDENYLTKNNMDALPQYVRIENVSFIEANGEALFAPDELANSSNIVERNVKLGSTNILFRLSTYADFATDTLPEGKLNITGVMTRFREDWQFMLNSLDDITATE